MKKLVLQFIITAIITFFTGNLIAQNNTAVDEKKTSDPTSSSNGEKTESHLKTVVPCPNSISVIDTYSPSCTSIKTFYPDSGSFTTHTWKWDFGYLNATANDPYGGAQYAYPSTNATYTVTLKTFLLNDTINACSVTQKTVTVNCTSNYTCMANFNYTNYIKNGTCNDSVKFKSSSTCTSLLWAIYNFGDNYAGWTGLNSNVNHTYPTTTSTYTATLYLYSVPTGSGTPCAIIEKTISVNCSPTTLKNEFVNQIDLVVYPNPFSENVSVELNNIHLNDRLHLTLTDAIGHNVLDQTITQEKINMNTSSFAKGIYFLTLSNQNGQQLKSVKLIK